MPVEFIGMIATRESSESRPAEPPVIDPGFTRAFARAHERSGFDRVLVGYYSDAADGFSVASDVLAHTERLGVLLAHRPGFVAPTLAARKLATARPVLRRPPGRAHHHRRQRRRPAARRRLPRPCRPIPPHRRVPRHPETRLDRRRAVRPRRRVLPVRGRLPDRALRPAAAPPDLLRRLVRRGRRRRGAARRRLRAVGRAAGRRKGAHRPRARRSGRARAPTGHQPVAAADPRRDGGGGVGSRATTSSSERASWPTPAGRGRPRAAERRLAAAARRGGARRRARPRLYTPIAEATGAHGNTTALVGTVEQVAESLLDYVDIGVTTLLIRGFDPYDDAVAYGDVVRAVRAEVAARDERAPTAARAR